jgi:ADP-ribose pyrophosphatase YjhB (NUDIX family)
MRDYDTTPCTELRPGDAAHMMVAIVLLTYRQGSLQVPMIEDQREPFDGQMSLPWCYVRDDQRIDQAARDLLFHELPMGDQDLEQVYTFSCPDRDARARVMCCSYLGAAAPGDFEWMSVENDRMMIEVRLDEFSEPRFSFQGLSMLVGLDHGQAVQKAILHIRGHLATSLHPWRMVPERFTLDQAQQVHEAILGKPLTDQGFRKSAVKRKLPDGSHLVATDRYDSSGAHRPARLYYLKRPPWKG